MAWARVGLYWGYHPKVTSSSYQGHWKVKLIKHDFDHASNGICMPFQPLVGGGGDYPLGIPLITPLSQRCSESTKLLRFSSVELQPQWQHMDTELGMKDDMGWCCALLGYHPKVTSRLSQGNCKVKLCFYLFQTHLGCSVGDYYKWLLLTHFCSDTISPRIANRNYAISPWGGGDYRLGIPFITPIPLSWSESTHVVAVATCSSVVEIDFESQK